MPGTNVIYEWTKFDRRCLSIDSFVTDLHVLANNCGFGELEDKLIRDRIVVGCRDDKLSESLQMTLNSSS